MINLFEPLEVLREGKYDTTKSVMTGMTTHESEIFVRSVFGEPMNDFGFVYGCRALFHALEDGKELLTRIFRGYNEDFANQGKAFPYCNSTIGDWSPVSSLPGVETYSFFEPTYPNISESLKGDWDGMLTMGNEVSEQNCQDRCEEGLQLPEVCVKLCSGIKICSAEGNCHNDC